MPKLKYANLNYINNIAIFYVEGVLLFLHFKVIKLSFTLNNQ